MNAVPSCEHYRTFVFWTEGRFAGPSLPVVALGGRCGWLWAAGGVVLVLLGSSGGALASGRYFEGVQWAKEYTPNDNQNSQTLRVRKSAS